MLDINSSKIQKFHTLLSESPETVIVTHMKPDGDALGSSISMYSFIASAGGRARIVLPHRHPSNLDFMISQETAGNIVIHEEKPEEAIRAIEQAELIICLDFNAFHRTDKLEQALSQSSAPKVLIDHHLNPDRECFDVIFSETAVSSASELLFHVLMEMPQIRHDARRLPSEALTALMTGMTTDTNNFANSVYPSTLLMASALLDAGTDRDMILANLYNRFSEDRLRLLGHILKDLMKVTGHGVAYIVLDRETLLKYNVAEGDTEGFVNMPLSIDKVKMSLLLKEDGDRIRVSIRSKKGISANRCARMYFNGGGHENAAGGKLNVPSDINDISCAGEYIEKNTYRFITEENEE